MIYLNSSIQFPSPAEASDEGLLAIGGDLSVERLLLAYRSGIFPWYDEQDPILWWSPDPRMVLFPKNLKISKSLQKTINKKLFHITHNQRFSEVIRNCSKMKRDGQHGTWITEEMIAAYENLHKLGYAISVEVWQNEVLVGGLYGIDLPEKKVFCGESMFTKVNDASKVGFVHWVKYLEQKEYQLIDCQVYTAHLESLGGEEISREVFVKHLNG